MSVSGTNKQRTEEPVGDSPRYRAVHHKGLGWMVYKGDEPVGNPMYGPYYARRAQAQAAAGRLEADDDESGPAW